MSDRQSTDRKTDREAIQRRLHLREVSSEFEHVSYDGIGSDLKATRVRNGLDLVAVARSLRIRLEYLLALEEGRFADLPGSVYAIGFVRTYAEHLGIDGEAAVDAYKQETLGQRAETKLLFPTPEPENRMPKGWLIGLSLALFALIYAGWYYAENKDQFVIEPVAQVPERLAAPEAAETPPQPAVRNEPAAPVKPAKPPEAAETAAAAIVQPIPMAAVTAEPVADPAPESVAQAETQPQPQTQPVAASQAVAEAEPAPAVEAAAVRPMAVVERPEPRAEAQAELQARIATETRAPSVSAGQTAEGINRRLLNAGDGQALQGPSPASVPVDVVAYPLPSRPRAALAVPAVEIAEPASPAATEYQTATVEAAPPSPPPAVAEDQVAAVVEPAPADPPQVTADDQVATIVDPTPSIPAPAAAAGQVTTIVDPVPPSVPPTAPQTEAPSEPQNAIQSTLASVPTSAATAAWATGGEHVPQIYGAGNWNARVVVQARADAWVQVTTESGDLLLTRVLRNGDKFLAPPRDDIVLTTGNAGALEIFVDGNRLPSIGALGEVARNLSLSADWLMARLRTDR